MPLDPKPSDEEILFAREIARAKEFSAYYRNGPHQKFVERGLPDFDTARARADALEAEYSKFGRKAIVYAISPLGTFDCNDRLMAIVADMQD